MHALGAVGPKLGAFLRLDGADKVLLVRALTTLTATKVALLVLPLRTAERLLVHRARNGAQPGDSAALVDRHVWAIETASSVLPRGSNCLLRALALETMLARHGIATTRRMGFSRTDQGDVEGHAWLTLGDRVLSGEVSDLWRFGAPPPGREGCGHEAS